ncbi:MAG: hypothetical protein O7B99_02435 [Planctomycetota bacterium]|nr:hypothetical protein [Planctomycetota bacterium]
MLTLCALALAAAQDVPKTMTAAEAQPALDKALEYLVATQEEDGSWSTSVNDDLLESGFSVETYYCWQVSSNALAVMALIEAEETPERRAALEKGLRWLCTTREPKRGSDWDSDFIWPALYGTVACVQAARDPRFSTAEWHELVETGGRMYIGILERNQVPTGGWAYYDDPIYSRRPKWGTSFCTALILPSIQNALEMKWIEDEAILERAHEYVARCALPNGAYEYDLNPIPRISGGEHINRTKGSLGRIQVCNWGRRAVGDKKITDDRLREGLDSFFTHHRFLDVARMRPIPHEAYYANAGYFYMFGHYYAAEAINLLEPDEREAWHAKLRPHVIKTQRSDGSTSDFLKSRNQLTACTAYLALTLQLGMPDEP